MSGTTQGLLDQPQQANVPSQAPNADGMAALYQGVTQQLAQQQQALQDQVLAQRQSPEGQRIPQAVVEQLGIGGNYGQLDTGKFNNFVAQQTGWNPGSLAGWGGGGSDAAGNVGSAPSAGPATGGLLGGLGAGPAATSGTVGATGLSSGLAPGVDINTTGPAQATGTGTGKGFDINNALSGGISGAMMGGPLGALAGGVMGGFGHGVTPGGIPGAVVQGIAALTHDRPVGPAIAQGFLGSYMANLLGLGGTSSLENDLSAQLGAQMGTLGDRSVSMSPSMSFEPGVGPGLAGMGSGGNPEEDTSGVEQGTW